MRTIMSNAGPRIIATVLCAMAAQAHAAGGVVVIGNANLAGLDASTLEKVYTGKVIEVGGVSVTAVNANSGSAVRTRFLKAYLNQDDDKYTAYWVVRRYIGKGVSPRELPSSAAIISFVRSTPGAIGYVDEADLPPDLNVLLK